MDKVEQHLDELLVKKAPFQLPENVRRGIVTALPWLSLLAGLFSLLGAWGLYTIASRAAQWTAYFNQVSNTYGYPAVNPGLTELNIFVWVGLAILLAQAVMFFVAFQPLRDHKKKGWTLLVLVTLVNVVYAVVTLLYNRDVMSLIFSLLGSVISLYLLFQVRGFYDKVKTAAPTTPVVTPKKSTGSDDSTADKKQ